MAFNRLPLKDKLMLKTEQRGGCLIWIGHRDRRGYGRIRLNGKWRRAHRVYYELLNGPIPSGAILLHSCDTPACINPAHLAVGTQLSNVQDMLRKRRANKARGEHNAKAKLTSAQVQEIRRRFIPYDRQHGARPLAREFGVSSPSISAIVKREAWAHIGPQFTKTFSGERK